MLIVPSRWAKPVLLWMCNKGDELFIKADDDALQMSTMHPSKISVSRLTIPREMCKVYIPPSKMPGESEWQRNQPHVLHSANFAKTLRVSDQYIGITLPCKETPVNFRINMFSDKLLSSSSSSSSHNGNSIVNGMSKTLTFFIDELTSENDLFFHAPTLGRTIIGGTFYTAQMLRVIVQMKQIGFEDVKLVPEYAGGGSAQLLRRLIVMTHTPVAGFSECKAYFRIVHTVEEFTAHTMADSSASHQHLLEIDGDDNNNNNNNNNNVGGDGIAIHTPRRKGASVKRKSTKKKQAKTKKQRRRSKTSETEAEEGEGEDEAEEVQEEAVVEEETTPPPPPSLATDPVVCNAHHDASIRCGVISVSTKMLQPALTLPGVCSTVDMRILLKTDDSDSNDNVMCIRYAVDEARLVEIEYYIAPRVAPDVD
jgi:hypothetical protein